MLPILQVGPLALPTPALAILLCTWLGLNLAERHADRYGLKSAQVYNLVMILLVAGLIGARLTYILRYPKIFAASPVSIVSLNLGLLDPVGGLVIGVLAGLVYAQRKKIPLWNALDALTPALGMLALGVALSHLASGAAFGAPSDLPWAINLWGANRHPSQVYEVIAAAIILAIIWPGRETGRQRRPGMAFLLFVALSAGARLLLEAFRGDSAFIFLGLRRAQALAWLALAGSLAGLYRLAQRERNLPPRVEEMTPIDGE
jgi:phosphatidylglycerol:prolipoprotein diacylglycerol transferase